MDSVKLCYHLQAMVNDGKMSLDDAMTLQEKMDLDARRKKLENHRIWQQKTGYWCTWVKDPKKKDGRRDSDCVERKRKENYTYPQNHKKKKDSQCCHPSS